MESKLPVPIHVGGGYGGDSDWLHGMWKGDKFTERLTYDMTDPAIVGRAGFGVIDHVGRAVCTEGGKSVEGWGCSSTARWGGTTRRASSIGSPSRPKAAISV